MGKTDPSKDKPKAPSRKEICDDLENAPKTDIVFQLAMTECPSVSSNTPEPSNSNTSQSSNSSKTSSGTKEDLDNTYNKVTKLIDLQERLLKEPDILNEKYELLRQLGEEVSQSISQIKSAAEK